MIARRSSLSDALKVPPRVSINPAIDKYSSDRLDAESDCASDTNLPISGSITPVILLAKPLHLPLDLTRRGLSRGKDEVDVTIMRGRHILALDQGTTSTKATVFRSNGEAVASHQIAHRQIFPQDGWVEHDAEEIWSASQAALRAVIAATSVDEIRGIGIANQRETVVLWERASGRPVANAIVWQDRRTADLCAQLKADGLEPEIQARTGLLLDPYFSGTKIAWLLDHMPAARERAERGELAFGTIESWLVFRLTGGRVHATDITNASRTLLFNIVERQWDDRLLEWLRVPRAILPEVRASAAGFGETTTEAIGAALPIIACVGDQQSAAIGQACIAPGLMKATYGTGCFAITNTGTRPIQSVNRLLGTVAFDIGGQVTYALEGSIFMAGATIQWLRDQMRFFDESAQSAVLAAAAETSSNVMMVPAFTGLGAPYWDPDARGAILNLTRADGIAEIVRAGLESVSFQTRDLLEAIASDVRAAGAEPPHALRVDGGMVVNDWFCQNLADLTGRTIERPVVTETTAFGAALIAALGTGLISNLEDVSALWTLDRRFEPQVAPSARDARYARWQEAVARVRSRPKN